MDRGQIHLGQYQFRVWSCKTSNSWDTGNLQVWWRCHKTEGATNHQSFSHHKTTGIFCQSTGSNSKVHITIWPKCKFSQDYMTVLVTWKFHEALIKKKGVVDCTRSSMAFFGIQEQVTLRLSVQSDWISKSSEMLCFSCLLCLQVWQNQWKDYGIMSKNICPIISFHSQGHVSPACMHIITVHEISCLWKKEKHHSFFICWLIYHVYS